MQYSLHLHTSVLSLIATLFALNACSAEVTADPLSSTSDAVAYRGTPTFYLYDGETPFMLNGQQVSYTPTPDHPIFVEFEAKPNAQGKPIYNLEFGWDFIRPDPFRLGESHHQYCARETTLDANGHDACSCSAQNIYACTLYRDFDQTHDIAAYNMGLLAGGDWQGNRSLLHWPATLWWGEFVQSQASALNCQGETYNQLGGEVSFEVYAQGQDAVVRIMQKPRSVQLGNDCRAYEKLRLVAEVPFLGAFAGLSLPAVGQCIPGVPIGQEACGQMKEYVFKCANPWGDPGRTAHGADRPFDMWSAQQCPMHQERWLGILPRGPAVQTVCTDTLGQISCGLPNN